MGTHTCTDTHAQIQMHTHTQIQIHTQTQTQTDTHPPPSTRELTGCRQRQPAGRGTRSPAVRRGRRHAGEPCPKSGASPGAGFSLRPEYVSH